MLQILALHVDYNNRPESGAEAAFVEQWCGERRIRFRKRVAQGPPVQSPASARFWL